MELLLAEENRLRRIADRFGSFAEDSGESLHTGGGSLFFYALLPLLFDFYIWRDTEIYDPNQITGDRAEEKSREVHDEIF